MNELIKYDASPLMTAEQSQRAQELCATEQPCAGCGKPLILENAWMEDGCPCNTPAGVNNYNLFRWKLLRELQQHDSRRAIAAEAALSAARTPTEEMIEAGIATFGGIVGSPGNLAKPEYVERMKNNQRKSVISHYEAMINVYLQSKAQA